MEERGTTKERGGREFYETICTWDWEATQHNRVITFNWKSIGWEDLKLPCCFYLSVLFVAFFCCLLFGGSGSVTRKAP